MAKNKVADVLVEVLEQAGVERIYGVTGDSLNGIADSIRRSKQIKWIHVRHEETAAFAAGAEAHLTGEIAVCAGSCGPGNLHLINGLFDCHRNRVPVLAIAAQIPSHEIGSSYFQETRPDHLFFLIAEYALDGDAGGSAIEAQILRRNERRDIHLPCGALNTEGPKTKIPVHSH